MYIQILIYTCMCVVHVHVLFLNGWCDVHDERREVEWFEQDGAGGRSWEGGGRLALH